MNASQVNGILSNKTNLHRRPSRGFLFKYHSVMGHRFDKVPVLGDMYARHAACALFNLANQSLDPGIATLSYSYYLDLANGNVVFDELNFHDDPKLVNVLLLAMELYTVQLEDKMYTDYITEVLSDFKEDYEARDMDETDGFAGRLRDVRDPEVRTRIKTDIQDTLARNKLSACEINQFFFVSNRHVIESATMRVFMDDLQTTFPEFRATTCVENQLGRLVLRRNPVNKIIVSRPL